ncbi:MAG: TIGR03564 family F420-dependent LLM class oxidoreductase [Actinomycetota bacterium]
MRIATQLDTDGTIDQTIERARALRDRGFTSLWAAQIFGPDTLTTFALVGRELPTLDLGTAVVPIQPRHPSMLAAQARTVENAIGGHLSLGVGLSHQVVVESMWGLSFERPASYMKEYLEALAPMLRGEDVMSLGERVKVVSGTMGPKEWVAPSLLVAALGPQMLKIAGTLTDGTCLWMTGVKTVASHIAPNIRAAAAAAGRPAPRIVCALPICVTTDAASAREKINEGLAVYPTLPSYAKMMAKEGAVTPADVGFIGSKEQVTDLIGQLAQAGATEFQAGVTGSRDEQEATYELLSSLI